MRIIALLAALLIATPVSAKTLCYYWVESDGTITSYQLPPINVATPNSLTDEDGSRLIIAPSRRCRDNAVLNAPPPQAAVTPPPAQPPATPSGPPDLQPVPEPIPDLQPVPESTPDFQLEPLEPTPEPLAESVPVPELQPQPEMQPETQLETQPAPDRELQPVPTQELRLESGESEHRGGERHAERAATARHRP